MTASESGEKAKVIDNRSKIGLPLVWAIVAAAVAISFFVGKSTTRADDGNALLTHEIESMRTENKTASAALKDQIENLKQSMELRAANRDKEIEAMNKRLDSHELSIHELFISINKAWTDRKQ